MLKVNRNNYQAVFFVSFVLLASGCKAEEVGFKGMDSEEKAFNERQSKELVAYMSLETMFPDRQARALAEAAGNGDVERIDELVTGGVEVNAQGTNGATPLFWAMRSDSIDGFRQLLELGADPNIMFGDGGTVMHWAAQLENTDFLKIAFEHGGDPNLVAGQLKHTPLFKIIGSSGESDLSALSILLKHGADPNVKDARGNTPAMIAAGMGRFDIVYKLLKGGADHSLKNDRGYSLLDRIASKRNVFAPGSGQKKYLEKVIAWLRERGVNIPEG